MSDCIITINGKEYTEFQLNEKLRSHEIEIGARLDTITDEELDEIFSKSTEFDETIAKVKEFQKDFKERSVEGKLDEEEKKYLVTEDNEEEAEIELPRYIKTGIGVTKLFNFIGNKHNWAKPLCTPYDEVNQKNRLINQFKKDPNYSMKTDAELAKMADNVIESYGFTGKLGTDIHKVISCIITGEAMPINFRKLPKHYVQKCTDIAHEIVNRIKKEHGDDCEILSEVGVASKRLNGSIPALLKQNTPYHKDYDCIYGFIDILVIDKRGIAHVYDIKTSEKKVGDWEQFSNDYIKADEYSSAKKMSNTAQVSTYANLLRQHNIRVGSCNIIPIQTSWTRDENKKATEVEGIELEEFAMRIPQSLSGDLAANIRQMLPANTESSNANVEKTNQLINDIYSTVAKFKQVKRTEKSVEAYMSREGFIRNFKPKDGNKKQEELAAKGIKYYFFKSDLPNGGICYCKTMDEVKVELAKYVDQVNSLLEQELENLGTQIALATSNGTEEALNDLASIFGEKNRETIKNQFRYYVLNGWEYEDNSDYANNGIFVFRKGDRKEIVAIDSRLLSAIENIGRGHTILGATKKDGDVDTTEILSSEYGNLLLMKLCAFVSTNREELLEDGKYKIARMRVLNPFHGTEYTALNKTLIENWKALNAECQFQRKDKVFFNLLNESDFDDDIKQCYDLATEIVRAHHLETDSRMDWISPGTRVDYDSELIDKAIFDLKKKYPRLRKKSNFNSNDPVWQVYSQLLRAKLFTKGLHVVTELDRGNFFEGIKPAGLKITSLDNSLSANARMMGRGMGMYRNNVTFMFNEYSEKWKRLLKAYFDKEGRSKFVGDDKKLYRDWIKTDENGNIDPIFEFKHESDPYWKDHPEALACCKFLMDTMWELRYGEIDEDTFLNQRSDQYYKIPLIEQSFSGKLKERGFKGSFDAGKNKLQSIWNTIQDELSGEAKIKRANEPEESLDDALPNPYVKSTNERTILIDKYGIEHYEKDFDTVFNVACLAGVQSLISKECSLMLNGLQVLTMATSANSKTRFAAQEPMGNIIKFMDDYIKNRFYNKSIVEEGMQTINSLVKYFKSMASVMALAFNTRTMFREAIQSGYTTFGRAAFNQLGDISADEMTKGYVYMTETIMTNKNEFDKVQLLSHKYSMCNYSMREMAEVNGQSIFKLFHPNSQIAFATSTVMDFYYRNAILRARMLKDGCELSYSLDADGSLVYDMTKDRRFSCAKVVDGKIQWDQSDPKKYREQVELYNKYATMFKQQDAWVISHGNRVAFEIGDALPDAYPAIIANGIRAEADTFLGHFDSETKALMLNTFLGSLFMQFKTIISAKAEGLFSPAHATNTIIHEQQYDEQGREIWEVFNTPEEFERTGIERYFLSDGNPETQEELDKAKEEGRAVSYKPMRGKVLEGTVEQAIDLAHAILNSDQEEINRIWKDPISRGRLYLLIMDNFGMLLLAFLVKLMFGEETVNDIQNQSWFTRWSYGAIMGAINDGPIDQVVKGMIGDFTPPMVGILKRAADSWGSVLAGDKNAFYAAVNTFGATRELTSVVNSFVL